MLEDRDKIFGRSFCLRCGNQLGKYKRNALIDDETDKNMWWSDAYLEPEHGGGIYCESMLEHPKPPLHTPATVLDLLELEKELR